MTRRSTYVILGFCTLLAVGVGVCTYCGGESVHVIDEDGNSVRGAEVSWYSWESWDGTKTDLIGRACIPEDTLRVVVRAPGFEAVDERWPIPSNTIALHRVSSALIRVVRFPDGLRRVHPPMSVRVQWRPSATGMPTHTSEVDWDWEPPHLRIPHLRTSGMNRVLACVIGTEVVIAETDWFRASEDVALDFAGARVLRLVAWNPDKTPAGGFEVAPGRWRSWPEDRGMLSPGGDNEVELIAPRAEGTTVTIIPYNMRPIIDVRIVESRTDLRLEPGVRQVVDGLPDEWAPKLLAAFEGAENPEISIAITRISDLSRFTVGGHGGAVWLPSAGLYTVTVFGRFEFAGGLRHRFDVTEPSEPIHLPQDAPITADASEAGIETAVREAIRIARGR